MRTLLKLPVSSLLLLGLTATIAAGCSSGPFTIGTEDGGPGADASSGQDGGGGGVPCDTTTCAAGQVCCPGPCGQRPATCVTAEVCPAYGIACPVDAGAQPDAGPGCATDADCATSPHGTVCGFLAANACSARGTCVPALLLPCAANGPVFDCACDGSNVDDQCPDLPSGYVHKPLQHRGACAAPDASTDAGAQCKTDADCGSGRVCGFPVADGCSANGTCFAAPGAVCLAYSPGCACDGSEVTLVCTGLPSGYARKPVQHTGACTGTDGGGADGGACCPATWDLHSCTYPDGGAGMACHNPAMGCASSLTCGLGCDQVVTGRCGP